MDHAGCLATPSDAVAAVPGVEDCEPSYSEVINIAQLANGAVPYMLEGLSLLAAQVVFYI